MITEFKIPKKPYIVRAYFPFVSTKQLGIMIITMNVSNSI